MSTQTVTHAQACADWLIARAEQAQQPAALDAAGFDPVWLEGAIREVRAYAREAGYIIPWPTALNRYTWVATRDDGTRRTGDEVRWKHTLTHMEQMLADLRVMAVHVAGARRVNTLLAATLNLGIVALDTSVQLLDGVADAMVERTPSGAPIRQRVPHVTRRPRVTAGGGPPP